MKEYTVHVQSTDVENLKEYGKVTTADAGRRPDSSGEGWSCWYPIGELSRGEARLIGVVHSEPHPLVLEAMESHLDREEWVFALDQPVIQVVALSSDRSPRCPDPATARAVYLKPGQGMIIAPGTWHAVGLPAAGEPIQYGFLLGRPTGKDQDCGWVKFADDAILHVIP